MIDYLSKYKNLEAALMRRKIFARISLLCKMILANYYGEERQKLINYIVKNKNYILKNKKVFKKDKMAVRLLLISPNLFEIVWKLYKKGEV